MTVASFLHIIHSVIRNFDLRRINPNPNIKPNPTNLNNLSTRSKGIYVIEGSPRLPVLYNGAPSYARCSGNFTLSTTDSSGGESLRQDERQELNNNNKRPPAVQLYIRMSSQFDFNRSWCMMCGDFGNTEILDSIVGMMSFVVCGFLLFS